MIRTVSSKFGFYVERLLALFQTHNITLPPKYELQELELDLDFENRKKASESIKAVRKLINPEESKLVLISNLYLGFKEVS